MSAKQDRVAPRTAEDIERRTNYGKSYSEILGIATDARKTAEQAKDEARQCHSEIIELADSITLKVTGGEAGNTASIVLTVGDSEYSGEINLTGLVTFESLQTSGETRINGDNVVSEGFDENGNPVRLTMNGGKLLFEQKNGAVFSTTATFDINGSSTTIASEEGLTIYGSRDSYFGQPNGPTYLRGDTVNIEGSRIFIDGRQCGWFANGDGSYSLLAYG